MRFTIKRACVAMAAIGVLSAVPSQAAVVVNGSFEDGSDPGSFTTANAGSSAITGWTIAAGSVDYIGNYWQAAQGSRSIDLAGNAIGAIEQTIDTIAGAWYKLSFFVSKNPDGGAPTRTGTVNVGGSDQVFSYALANDRSNMQWDLRSLVFQAQGPTTLRFGADDSSGGFYGLALDNISISAIPEPATWAMTVLGFGAVGFAMRRRTRRAAAKTSA
jgi:choice-of-anchor C domain-containing protein